MAIRLCNPIEARDLSERDEAVLIDVRTEAEFAAGHPTGALNIPAFVPGLFGKQLNMDFVSEVEAVVPRDRQVLCFCAAGVRSLLAAQLLEQAGYERATNVLGGYHGGYDPAGAYVAGWLELNLPVATEG
jgi:rhodanese-related sulfurtransferase